MPKEINKIAEKIVRGMAYNRKTFKNKVQEYISGAILEYYKARYSELVGKTEWVAHWDREVDNLINRSLLGALRHPAGFNDLRKAFDEIVAEFRGANAAYMLSAKKLLETRYYKNSFRIRKQLDPQVTEDFFQMLELIAEIGLSDNDPEDEDE